MDKRFFFFSYIIFTRTTFEIFSNLFPRYVVINFKTIPLRDANVIGSIVAFDFHNERITLRPGTKCAIRLFLRERVFEPISLSSNSRRVCGWMQVFVMMDRVFRSSERWFVGRQNTGDGINKKYYSTYARKLTETELIPLRLWSSARHGRV